MAELICDGVHVHESAVRAAFSLFSAARIILVSDALSCLGMPEGVYESGGQKIYMKNGAAVLSDGVTFAGSTTDLFQCMRKAVSFGIKAEDAVRSATANPARAVGAYDRVGSVTPGKAADFIVCDREFNIKKCYIDGKEIRENAD
jgi:N-acetylglucosamine-6-phosphate deacetylase